jgi:hypothetical protein
MPSVARRIDRRDPRRRRRSIARLAGLALLLELFLGLPASLAMAADVTAGEPVCSTAGPRWVPSDQRPGADRSHRHDGCVLCHDGAGRALPADPAPAVVLLAASLIAQPPVVPLPATLRAPPQGYTPRAPPPILLG